MPFQKLFVIFAVLENMSYVYCDFYTEGTNPPQNCGYVMHQVRRVNLFSFKECDRCHLNKNGLMWIMHCCKCGRSVCYDCFTDNRWRAYVAEVARNRCKKVKK